MQRKMANFWHNLRLRIGETKMQNFVILTQFWIFCVEFRISKGGLLLKTSCVRINLNKLKEIMAKNSNIHSENLVLKLKMMLIARRKVGVESKRNGVSWFIKESGRISMHTQIMVTLISWHILMYWRVLNSKLDIMYKGIC